MPVAAAIFAAQPASALADVDGVPAARHLAQVARDAGIGSVFVVSFDPDGTVAAAIDGAATLVEPAPPEGGPVAQLARGVDAAVAADPATTAVLLWPARVTDMTADVVRSLVSTSSLDALAIVHPGDGADIGFPALFPVRHRDALDTIGPDRMPGQVLNELADGGIPTRVPGSTADERV
jgi:CTP:molybdopterin cytidylyltransferase MocA